MKRLLMAMLAFVLPGCSAVEVGQYRDQGPALDLSRYFDGRVQAWGMFQDRSGEVVRRFQVTIDGRWEGDTGVLDERFVYDDGSTGRRVWTLKRVAPDRYVGSADDVIGEAMGETAGNAFHWRYTLRLPVGERTYDMHMDDWMWLIDEDTLVNRTSMRKFGIEFGQVTLFFRRGGAG